MSARRPRTGVVLTSNATNAGGNASAPLTEDEKVALQHTWDWFALHSGQRMQLVSSYFVAQALVVAGYGTALQGKAPVAAAGLAAAGLFLGLGFYAADLRTRELIKASEPALAHFEDRLATVTGRSELALAAGVETPAVRGTSYSRVIALFVATMSLLLIAGFVYALSEVGEEDDAGKCRAPASSSPAVG